MSQLVNFNVTRLIPECLFHRADRDAYILNLYDMCYNLRHVRPEICIRKR